MQRSLIFQNRYADRAKVIIFSSEGLTIDQFMEQTRLSRPALSKWCQQFKSSGIAGLKDGQQSGKRPVITQV